MEIFKIFAFDGEGKAKLYAEIKDRFGYYAAVEKYFAKKQAAGKPLDEDDSILQTILDRSYVIPSADFKRVMQALRHFDEIGISNDVHDIIEEIKEDGGYTAVSLNGDY